MKVVVWLTIFIVALFEGVDQRALAEDGSRHYVNEVAVQVEGDETVADLVAGTHGFRVKRKLQLKGNYYLFDHPEIEHRSKRSADDLLSKLKSDPNVKFVEQQRLLVRDKRRIVHDKQLELPIRNYEDKSVYQRFYGDEYEADKSKSKKYLAPRSTDVMRFKDPFWPDMWYLYNFGQSGGPPGYDVNVINVWLSGFTGKGVVVCILDDGIENTHPDLIDNYDSKASYDLNDKDPNPMPDVAKHDNSHGTRCAGEVAAKANNTVCGVGIAYNAGIGGVRMLDGPITDSLESEAIEFNNDYIHIKSSSWGPSDDGRSLEGPSKLTAEALKQGALEGRNGLGVIYMWATGNGGMNDDTCSCDGYVSSIYTVAIGSISDHGLSTYFSEICPATLAVIFTGGSHKEPGEEDYKSPKLKVTTTDINGGCTLEFQGTSSASPLAAGCVALTLEANPKLTWRDVQHIIVHTARIPNAEQDDNEWTENGAGFHVNPKFGFGAMDCGRMVELAQNWTTVGEHHACESDTDEANEDIPKRGTLIRKITYQHCKDPGQEIDSLEHVEIHVKIEHPRRGDVNMFLVSPSGTRSEILRVRPRDKSSDGIDFTFMEVHTWGEDPRGDWTLEVADRSKTRYDYDPRTTKRGKLIEWGLKFYGTCCSQSKKPDKVDRMQNGKPGKNTGDNVAHSMDIVDLKHTMIQEEEESNNLQIKSEIANDEFVINTLKSLNDMVSGLKHDELEELLTGKKKSQQRNYNDYNSRTSSSKPFYPNYINSLHRKSYSDSYTNDNSYKPDHRKESEKRRLQDDKYDFKELEKLVNELLEE